MKSFVLLCLVALTGCTSISSKVEIDAPATRVREVLYRFEDYPAWNPFIVKVDGTIAEGKRVSVTVRPVGKAEITGETKILALADNRLVWQGSLKIPGLFHGVHEFRIEDLGGGRTMFYNSEKMSGAVIPFYDFKPTQAGFEAMNAALKARVEGTR